MSSWAPSRAARHVRRVDAVALDARAVGAAVEALGGGDAHPGSLPLLLDAYCVVWAVGKGGSGAGAVTERGGAFDGALDLGAAAGGDTGRDGNDAPTSSTTNLTWLYTSEAVPLPAHGGGGGVVRWAPLDVVSALQGLEGGGGAPAVHLHVLARARRRQGNAAGDAPWPTAPGVSVARAVPHPPGDCGCGARRANKDTFLLASATLVLRDGRPATQRRPGAGAPPGTVVLTIAGAGRLEWRPVVEGGGGEGGAPPSPHAAATPAPSRTSTEDADAGHLSASGQPPPASLSAVKAAAATTAAPAAPSADDGAAAWAAVDRLAAVGRRLAAARASAAAATAALEAVLTRQHGGGGDGAAAVAAAEAEAAASAARADADGAQATADREATAALRTASAARASVLIAAWRGLAAGRAELAAATAATHARLHRGALGAATRALAARRAALVADAGDALGVGIAPPALGPGGGGGLPPADSAASTPWARLEAGWSGGGGGGGGGGAGLDVDGGAGGSGSVSGSEGGHATSSPSRAGGSLAGWLFGGGGGGGPASVAGSDGDPQPASSPHAHPPPVRRRPAHPPLRFTIGGLPLDPGIVRAWVGGPAGGTPPALAAGKAAARARAAVDAAALGHAAALTAAAAAALGIPLRHPLIVAGSRSAVLAAGPPAGTARGRCGEGRGDAVGAAVLLPGALPPGQRLAGVHGESAAPALTAGSPAAAVAAAAATGEGAFPLWPPGDGGGGGGTGPAVVAAAAAAAASAATLTNGAAQPPPAPPLTSDPARFAYAVFLLARDVHQVLDALGLAPPPAPGAVLDGLVRIVALARQGRGSGAA